MNKPEKISMPEFDQKECDALQTRLTGHMRMVEICLTCAMKESEGMVETHPELYAMIRGAAQEAGILHVYLGTLQKMLYDAGALSKSHADSILPMWGPNFKLTDKLIPIAAGGCKP